MIKKHRLNGNAGGDNSAVYNPRNRGTQVFHIDTVIKFSAAHACMCYHQPLTHHSNAFEGKDGRSEEERVVFSSANFWEVSGVWDVL